MKDLHKGQSGAERRALWEVRKRHNIPISSPKKHSRRFRILRLAVILLFLGGLFATGIFGYKILAAGNSISTAKQSILGQISDLFLKSGKELQGEEMDQINILLLAIGGEGHSGENLADTVMVASIKPKENKIALFSIPRDLYVQVPGQEFYSKLNAVHAYGEAEKKGNGPILLEQSVEEITGLDIHYFARVDFTAFKKIVEAIGGVNITVENGFFDYWHKISFPKGTETMNGDRALAYVRARYIEGPEGGDFQRAARQQQMLIAIRDKVFSLNTALDFTAINGILESVSEDIRTSLQLWEMKRFFEIARQLDTNSMKSVVLTTGPHGVLVGETAVLGGVPASVLKPRTGDYSEIQSLAQNMFSEGVGTTIADTASQDAPQPTIGPEGLLPSTPSPSPEPEEESAAKPTIEVRNGTAVNGLAKKISDQLASEGYEIVATANARANTIEETTIYAPKVTQADDAQKIASTLDAASKTDFPADEAKTSADILIVLGKDSAN